jgi:hypothetical protein
MNEWEEKSSHMQKFEIGLLTPTPMDSGLGVFGTVVHALSAHPGSMKMIGREFWTQITQNTRSTQINIRVFCEICVFCVPYSVTKVSAIFEAEIQILLYL